MDPVARRRRPPARRRPGGDPGALGARDRRAPRAGWPGIPRPLRVAGGALGGPRPGDPAARCSTCRATRSCWRASACPPSSPPAPWRGGLPRRAGAGPLRRDRRARHLAARSGRRPPRSASSSRLAGHAVGWPIARGGSQQIVAALASYLRSLGGEIVTDSLVTDLADLPPARATILDVTPAQFLRIAGKQLPDRLPPAAIPLPLRARHLQGRLGARRADPLAGPGVPPRRDRPPGRHARRDGRGAARRGRRGNRPSAPLVLLVQPTLFDPSRAPAGKQIAWGYCHVPLGSTFDMTDADRGAGRALRARLPRPDHRAPTPTIRPRSSGTTRTWSAATSAAARRPSASSSSARRRGSRPTPPPCRTSSSAPPRRRRAAASTAWAATTPRAPRCGTAGEPPRDAWPRQSPSARRCGRRGGSLPAHAHPAPRTTTDSRASEAPVPSAKNRRQRTARRGDPVSPIGDAALRSGDRCGSALARARVRPPGASISFSPRTARRTATPRARSQSSARGWRHSRPTWRPTMAWNCSIARSPRLRARGRRRHQRGSGPRRRVCRRHRPA